MSLDFTRLSDVELVAGATETANVLIEDDGEIKKVPQSEVGGKKHWDDIEGKPFGEKTVMGDTLTWDGNTEGLEVGDISVEDVIAYLITDAVPTFEEFKKLRENGGSCRLLLKQIDNEVVDEDNSGEFSLSTLYLDDYNRCASSNAVHLQFEDLCDEDGSVWLKKGIYLYVDTYFKRYTAEFQLYGYNGFERTEITTIPEKYLPTSGGTDIKVVVDNDNNIIDCPITYDELKESIENGKPPMITLFCNMVYDSDNFSEITCQMYPADRFLIHYDDHAENNYIDVACKYDYYLNFRENGEITFYSVD